MGRGEVRPRLPAGWAPPDAPSGSPGWGAPLGAFHASLALSAAAAEQSAPGRAQAGCWGSWPPGGRLQHRPLRGARRPPAGPAARNTRASQFPRRSALSSSVWAALAARQATRLGKGAGPTMRGGAEDEVLGVGGAWVRYLRVVGMWLGGEVREERGGAGVGLSTWRRKGGRSASDLLLSPTQRLARQL